MRKYTTHDAQGCPHNQKFSTVFSSKFRSVQVSFKKSRTTVYDFQQPTIWHQTDGFVLYFQKIEVVRKRKRWQCSNLENFKNFSIFITMTSLFQGFQILENVLPIFKGIPRVFQGNLHRAVSASEQIRHSNTVNVRHGVEKFHYRDYRDDSQWHVWRSLKRDNFVSTSSVIWSTLVIEYTSVGSESKCPFSVNIQCWVSEFIGKSGRNDRQKQS